MGNVIGGTETGWTTRLGGTAAVMGMALMMLGVGCSSQTATTTTTTSSSSQNPGEPPGVSNPVSWATNNVSLTASDFWFVADGQTYLVNPNAVDVHSDAGTPTYTTLEITWTERDREMRFNIYFQSDGSKWGSDEMRTYDGQPTPYGNWLFYTGLFFQSPYGSPFHGDIDLTNDTSDSIRGDLHLHGVSLSIHWSPAP